MLLCIHQQQFALYVLPEIEYGPDSYYIVSYLTHHVIKITNVEGFYFRLKTIVAGILCIFPCVKVPRSLRFMTMASFMY